MNIENLKTKLHEIERITNQECMNSLDDRKKKELEFHDLDRDKTRVESLKGTDTYEQYYGNKKYYSGNVLSRTYIDEWITKHAENKIFLDYACGNGSYAIKAAKAGAALSIGIDISSDCENTKLPDNCIDTVICSGMLHHLDLSYAFPELRRILRGANPCG